MLDLYGLCLLILFCQLFNENLFHFPLIFRGSHNLILAEEDLPNSPRPRIVKLHGSFPSKRPFIITEEDFRTYPNKFPVFVNTVQQAIMENCLCLLGFSGNDPNFLHWSGWVRDHLGNNAAPIYLCGLFDVSDQEKFFWNKKNVFIVDLGELFPANEWPDKDTRYKKAYEWFLLSLHYGKPVDSLDWPKQERKIPFEPTPDLPLIRNYKKEALSAPQERRTIETIREAVLKWQAERETYPGWILCPYTKRNQIFSETSYTMRGWNLKFFEQLEFVEKLDLWYEVVWRMNVAMHPLYQEWFDQIVLILKSYNPFPDILNDNDLFNIQNEDALTLSSEAINKWVSLVFAIIQDFREIHNVDEFNKWQSIVAKIKHLNTEWHHRWFYEQCLWYLQVAELSQLSKTLSDWKVPASLPYWLLMKAKLLASINEIKQATDISLQVLDKIRTKNINNTINIYTLSLEGWAMLLIEILRFNMFRTDDVEQKFQDRWRYLQNHQCNPKIEIEYLANLLQKTPPVPEEKESITKQFDPQSISINKTIVSGIAFEQQLFPAFNGLRLHDITPIPTRKGDLPVYPKIIENACIWLADQSNIKIELFIVKTGDYKLIDRWFSRFKIATLSLATINTLYSFTLNSLNFALSKVLIVSEGLSGFSVAQIEWPIELLSRLSFRLSKDKVEILFSIAIKLFNDPQILRIIHFHVPLFHLFERIILAMEPEQVIHHVKDLASAAIHQELSSNKSMYRDWHEPMQYIDLTLDYHNLIESSQLVNTVRNLLNMAETNEGETRKRTLFRLGILYHLGYVENDLKIRFAQVLWSKVDEIGLPVDTMFTLHGIQNLPEPETGKFEKVIKDYYLGKDFFISEEALKNNTSSFFHRSDNELLSLLYVSWLPINSANNTVNKIKWPQFEAEKLFESIVAGWDQDKSILQKNIPDILELNLKNIKGKYFYFTDVLAEIVIPATINSGELLKEKILATLNELVDFQISTKRGLWTKLYYRPEIEAEIVQEILVQLSASKEKQIRDAIDSIKSWALHAKGNQISRPPDGLVDELFRIISTRRIPSLLYAFDSCATMIQKLPESFTKANQEFVLNGLKNLYFELDITEFSKNTALSIKESDVPAYLQEAAKFILICRSYFIENQIKLPDILEKWYDRIKSHPLPEVRQLLFRPSLPS